MKEIVIISGKGGTGKTSITAAFASLASNSILADCDVDAADLHLIMNPKILKKHEFRSGNEAVIKTNICTQCGKCKEVCRFDAISYSISRNGARLYSVTSHLCEGCGVCVEFCPTGAIQFPERVCGDWFISDTRFGKMVHAKLGLAAENSGKLVSIVRREAKKIAEESNSDMVIIDGPPGIGCPVIASITGTDGVVIVTEPTFSGKHDLERVLELTSHFNIKSYICINKWDINPKMSSEIERAAKEKNAIFVGKIPYSGDFTKAQIESKSIIEYTNNCITDEIRSIWEKLCLEMKI